MAHLGVGNFEDSRGAQQVGLFVGFLIYGLTWSLLFGAVFHLAQRWLPDWSPLQRGLALALAAYWSVALFPFLKYPANPPGVGDPETISYRQALYMSSLGLSVLGTALAIALARARRRGWQPALAFLAVFAVAVYVLLPGNTDAIEMPMQIVTTFRALSLAGLSLFWSVLGVTFGALLRRRAAQAVVVRPRVALT